MGASFVALLFLATAPAMADERGAVMGPAPERRVLVAPTYEPHDTYGVSSLTVLTVRVEEFRPKHSAVDWWFHNDGGMYQTTPQTDRWFAPVHLPSGAFVERVELEACDSTPTGSLLFGMVRALAPSGAFNALTPIGDTGVPATPGCAFYPLTPDFGAFAVENRFNSYLVYLRWNLDFTSVNRAAAVRVYYRLSVSQPPATARFSDVPVGHPLHRFVEALAAAGITAGCTATSFCPDLPLTRGEMAVFLVTALGLHFPN